jgi:competence protein ComEC
LLQRLDAAMPAAEAGLLKAMVLGDRSGLTPEMTRAFLDSGTYHILAISGLNVSLLAGALFGLLRVCRISPRVAAGASAILVTLYAVLAGAGASVTRAAVMADVYLLAIVLDRRADMLNSLALSALALMWWNPRFVAEVGFQLTFLATLGIVLIVPVCHAKLAVMPRPLRWVMDSVALTAAATAMTLPILAASFNRVSPAGLLANIPIVPLSGLITGLGTAACAVLLAVPTGLQWLNAVNGWLADALFALARQFGSWPWSSIRVYTPTAGMLLCYYGALAVALAPIVAGPRGSTRSSWRRWTRWGVVGCCLVLAGQISWRLGRPGDDGRVRLTVLDVGQGEAIYIAAPTNGRMLVDAGGMLGESFDVGERVIAPFLWHEWVSGLDVVVVTHSQSDHIGGLPTMLRTFRVGEVWTGGSLAVSPADVWIQEYLRHRRIPHRVVAAGDPPRRWGDIVVRVVHPGPADSDETPPGNRGESRANDRSVVLRVELGDQAALLAGDLERNGEAALLRSGATLAAQVLKVPHHGSRQSSTDAFIRAVRPDAALISVGHRNPFRHPHPDIVARYEAAGARVWRTDRHGAISVDMTANGTRVSGRRDASEP